MFKRNAPKDGPIGVDAPGRPSVSPLTPDEARALKTRRRFLQITFGGSLAAISVAAAFPVLAIKSLTQYQDVIAQGDVVADQNGETPLDISTLAVGAGIWVTPLYKDPKAQQNLVELVRVASNGDADDFRAYSQICTHLGCPVSAELLNGHIHCNCHGSQFNPEDGSVVQGPAAKALPSIALALNDEGQLIFDSDEYSATIGPG